MVQDTFKIWPLPLHSKYSGIRSSEWPRIPQIQNTQIYPKSMLCHLLGVTLLVLSPVKAFLTFLAQVKCHIIVKTCPDLLRQSRVFLLHVSRECHQWLRCDCRWVRATQLKSTFTPYQLWLWARSLKSIFSPLNDSSYFTRLLWGFSKELHTKSAARCLRQS